MWPLPAQIRRPEASRARLVPGSWTSNYLTQTASTVEATMADTDSDLEASRRRWQESYAASRVRDVDFTTLSGVEVEPVYGPEPGSTQADFERIGWPGEYPFTRGLYPTGYRGRSWTIRQFAGFGNARPDQRALQDDPRSRRRRTLRRLRHADADGPRQRRPAGARRGRPLRGGDRQCRRHGGAVRAASRSRMSRPR